ncbi:alpha-rhamnosidase [Cohnella silvisoli]|uniref:Alpha-rhamnosidase n=1 Tax=Cohnella silvisoli TaxID=2873699 RepID=A0ABV1KRQ3_9BACL|nr:alpha-rhamnosidase [Cohnella silvisoli]MCD9022486.1 alpha-rhamnosidase [Cohnella silvisoli]
MGTQTLTAAWIWYPGDLEIGLHREVSLRRDERGTIVPPFWRLDTFYGSVKFRKFFELEAEEEIALAVEGQYNITLDGQLLYGNPTSFKAAAGKHEIIISVVNDRCMPAIFVQGATLVSDRSWLVCCNNQIWLEADCGDFHLQQQSPSSFRLPVEEIVPVEEVAGQQALLVDFGKEIFGFLRISPLSGNGTISFYYGESQEEALSVEDCETFDHDHVDFGQNAAVYVTKKARAFRYVNVICDEAVHTGPITALHEYLPVSRRGQFNCSSERLNQIWEVSAYTLHLTTREFFIDGIKRDRWVWSGDAYQSLLMNFYLFFDQAVNRRTWIALRGKEPVETHINHIVDYSFYWFMGVYDHYLYTGDQVFVRQQYPKMASLMQFCLNRRNDNGMIEGYGDDWVFIDWADMDKKGEVSFEQILFCRSLEIMAELAELLQDPSQANYYGEIGAALKRQIFDVFWDETQGGLVHNRVNGQLNGQVTRYASMFAMMLGYLNEEQIGTVKADVLLNDCIQKIKTPYMRFYELAALCEVGEHANVLKEIEKYWGGMLDLGATTFWEEYDPLLRPNEQYAMYGRPYGKSLCHAWGASPLYLLGKYFLGVQPTSPGYATYRVEPVLAGLEWIRGVVPMPEGQIEIYMDRTQVIVSSDAGEGVLRIRSAVPPTCELGPLIDKGDGYYELQLNQQGIIYPIYYTAL